MRNVPAGKTTVPPPRALAASIAAWIAFESSAAPSPCAPNVVTS
jgi:hypothetical protein